MSDFIELFTIEQECYAVTGHSKGYPNKKMAYLRYMTLQFESIQCTMKLLLSINIQNLQIYSN